MFHLYLLQLPICSHTIRLLSVSRLDHQKDTITLLKSFELLDPNLEWHLDIVGDGPLYPHILEYISNSPALSGRVSLIGHSSNVSKYYQQSHVFVLCSNWEGLPITILEAMSHGLPIVHRVGGCPELVFDGVNGFLVQKNDPKTLADSLSSLITNPTLRLNLSVNSEVL